MATGNHQTKNSATIGAASVSKPSSSSIPKRSSVLEPPTLLQPGINEPVTTSSGTVQRGNRKGLPAISNFKGGIASRTKVLLSTGADIYETTAASTELPLHPSEVYTSPHVSGSNVRGSMTPPASDGQSNAPTNVSPDASESAMEEDDSQEMDANVTKRKRTTRGLTRRVGLHRQNERAGKKLKVTIDPHYGRALGLVKDTAVGTELGIIASHYIWPVDKICLKTRILEEVLLKLEVKLNIVNIDDPIIKKILRKRFNKIVKDKRWHFKQEYVAYANGEEARRHRPANLEQEIWNNLCNYWETPKVKFQAIDGSWRRSLRVFWKALQA